MPRVNIATIEGYFDSIGWKYRRYDDDTVITGVAVRTPHGRIHNLRLEVVKSRHWVSIHFYLLAGFGAENIRPILLFLNQLNREVHLFQYVIADRSVLLQIDIPANHLSEEVFTSYLENGTKLAGQSVFELSTLVASPSVAKLVDGVSAAELGEHSLGTDRRTSDLDDFEMEANLIS